MKNLTLKEKWKRAIKNPLWWLLIVGYIALVETMYLTLIIRI